MKAFLADLPAGEDSGSASDVMGGGTTAGVDAFLAPGEAVKDTSPDAVVGAEGSPSAGAVS